MPDAELDELVADVHRQLATLTTDEQTAFRQSLQAVAALPAMTARDKRHRQRLRRLLAEL
jgi:hypothetical protein